MLLLLAIHLLFKQKGLLLRLMLSVDLIFIIQHPVSFSEFLSNRFASGSIPKQLPVAAVADFSFVKLGIHRVFSFSFFLQQIISLICFSNHPKLDHGASRLLFGNTL